MNAASAFDGWVVGLPPGPLVGVALAVNVGLVAVGLPLAGALAWASRGRRASPPPPPVTAGEIGLAVLCTAVNTAVFVAGVLLRKAGIVAAAEDSPGRVLADFVRLFVAMDLAMYLFHRIAHLRPLFPIAHAVHHRYRLVRPLSLFALHPGEAAGFGALWLLLLAAYPTSPAAMTAYLVVNTAFGFIGHLGVEFLPKRALRWPLVGLLGTSTFHAQHHLHERVNFGFYTIVWDRLFGTIYGKYEEDFPE